MTIEELENEMRELQASIYAAKDRLVDVRRQLDEARLAKAQEAGHEWLGRAVWRTERVWGGDIRTLKGVVALYNPREHQHLRGRPFGISSGELVVVSHGGKTLYAWDGAYDWKGELRDGCCGWVLAE